VTSLRDHLAEIRGRCEYEPEADDWKLVVDDRRDSVLIYGPGCGVRGVPRGVVAIIGTRCRDVPHAEKLGRSIVAAHDAVPRLVAALEGVLAECERMQQHAAWIPDTGRFADALGKATFGEVEPFPAGKVVIGRGSIVDCCRLAGDPPRDQS